MLGEIARPRVRRLLSNTLHAASGRLAAVFVWLLLTPTVLHALGPERFGLWSIFFALTGYFGGFDLGLAQGTLRHVAAARVHGLRDVAAAHTVLAFGGYLLLGLVWLALMIAACGPLLDFLRVPAPLHPDATRVLIGSALAFVLSGWLNVLVAALQGHGRFDLANRVLLTCSLSQGLGVWLALGRHAGIGVLIGVLMAGWLLGVLVALAMLPLAAPGGGWVAPWRAWSQVRAALRFGLPMQAASLSSVIHQHLDKFLLSRFVGLATVAPYEIGFRVSSAAVTFPQQFLLAAMPAAAELQAEGRAETLRTLFVRGDRYVMAGTAVWLAALVGGAAPLLVAWLGPGQGDAILATRGLAVAWAVALVTGMGVSLARGIGRTGLEARFALVVLAVHAGLSLWWVPRYGLRGALLATICGNLVGALVFLWSLAGALGWNRPGTMFGGRAMPVIAAMAGVAAAAGSARWLVPGRGVRGWAAALATAAAGGAIAALVLFVTQRPGEEKRGVPDAGGRA
ncbi:MAG TPA: polysaccharide biosynthesis C-terminal domain-containing protein [Dongiaceae bacterium]|nr:polysaccharide biosynthesis C-terminal domain-containing protein [Dongiaceae bacterium]